MAIFDQIGCEGYLTESVIEEQTNFLTTSAITTVDGNILNITGEKWYAGGYANIHRTWTQDFVSTQIEIEAHMAWYIDDDSSPHKNNSILLVNGASTSSSSTTDINVNIEIVTNPLNSSQDVLQINYEAGQPADNKSYTTDKVLESGQLYYFVIRMRGGSGTSTNDGAYEVWINNELLASEHNMNYNTSNVSEATFDGNKVVFFGTSNTTSTKHWMRNLQIHDAWTSADNVAPALRHVIDSKPETITYEAGTTWTNEGGAATDVIAVSDNNDATFIESYDAAGHAVFTMDRPTELSGQTSLDMVVRGRVGRATSNTNNISIALVTNAMGLVENSSDTQNIAAVGTGRETFEKKLATTGTTQYVKITNGS